MREHATQSESLCAGAYVGVIVHVALGLSIDVVSVFIYLVRTSSHCDF